VEPAETVIDSIAPLYNILPKGSQRGKPLLVSDDGFSYTIRRAGKRQTTWRCSNRKCSGAVTEMEGNFGLTNAHIHEGRAGLGLGLEIKMKVKYQPCYSFI